MKHKKLPQRRKERRGNDEKINSQLRRVGKSIKPLRILCDLCASAVNNFVILSVFPRPKNPTHSPMLITFFFFIVNKSTSLKLIDSLTFLHICQNHYLKDISLCSSAERYIASVICTTFRAILAVSTSGTRPSCAHAKFF